MKQERAKSALAPAKPREMKKSSLTKNSPTLTKKRDAGTKGDAEARLKQLKRLHEQGLIEKGEYDEKRKRILDAL